MGEGKRKLEKGRKQKEKEKWDGQVGIEKEVKKKKASEK